LKSLDSGFRRNDVNELKMTFYDFINIQNTNNIQISSSNGRNIPIGYSMSRGYSICFEFWSLEFI